MIKKRTTNNPSQEKKKPKPRSSKLDTKAFNYEFPYSRLKNNYIHNHFFSGVTMNLIDYRLMIDAKEKDINLDEIIYDLYYNITKIFSRYKKRIIRCNFILNNKIPEIYLIYSKIWNEIQIHEKIKLDEKDSEDENYGKNDTENINYNDIFNELVNFVTNFYNMTPNERKEEYKTKKGNVEHLCNKLDEKYDEYFRNPLEMLKEMYVQGKKKQEKPLDELEFYELVNMPNESNIQNNSDETEKITEDYSIKEYSDNNEHMFPMYNDSTKDEHYNNFFEKLISPKYKEYHDTYSFRFNLFLYVVSLMDHIEKMKITKHTFKKDSNPNDNSIISISEIINGTAKTESDIFKVGSDIF